jgi:hypothetical protein
LIEPDSAFGRADGSDFSMDEGGWIPDSGRVGFPDAIGGPVDTGGPIDSDGPPGPLDSGFKFPDGGGAVDGGSCSPADCEAMFGSPRCPNGPGKWTCDMTGQCSPICAGMRQCNMPSDCDQLLGPTPCPGGSWNCDLSTGTCSSNCPPPPPGPSSVGCICSDNTRAAACAMDCDPMSTASACSSVCFQRGGGMATSCATSPGCQPPTCQSDCDCAFDSVCAMGSCQPGPGNNCCSNPNCLGPCVLPGGGSGFCPGPPDAGLFFADAGPPGFDVGPPPFDGGPPGFDGGPPPLDAGLPCQSDCDCPSAEACAAGTCAFLNRENMCCTNPLCPPGAACIEPNGMMAICPSPPTPIGAACSNNTTCGPIGFCIGPQSGFPDGYCSQSCGAMNPCPQGASCRDFGGGGTMSNPICIRDCSSRADCRPGYACIQLGTETGDVCFPVPAGSTNAAGAPIGSACMQDQDCVSGSSCLAQQTSNGQVSWTAGYCTVLYCDPQNRPCPAQSLCYAFASNFSMCLLDCPNAGTQSTCRTGYYCLGPTGMTGGCLTR